MKCSSLPLTQFWTPTLELGVAKLVQSVLLEIPPVLELEHLQWLVSSKQAKKLALPWVHELVYSP